MMNKEEHLGEKSLLNKMNKRCSNKTLFNPFIPPLILLSIFLQFVFSQMELCKHIFLLLKEICLCVCVGAGTWSEAGKIDFQWKWFPIDISFVTQSVGRGDERWEIEWDGKWAFWKKRKHFHPWKVFFNFFFAIIYPLSVDTDYILLLIFLNLCHFYPLPIYWQYYISLMKQKVDKLSA